MSDIVERLRTINSRSLYGELLEMTNEAADTIERCYGAIADLQAEVRRKSDEIERLRKELEDYQSMPGFVSMTKEQYAEYRQRINARSDPRSR